ncbi:hypothetical protein K501DRAFT_265481 [Backusella circina FSU 941]|nr:hypothetical protein K501DRAFT_265481 [Backusella circina FSU 941]
MLTWEAQYVTRLECLESVVRCYIIMIMIMRETGYVALCQGTKFCIVSLINLATKYTLSLDGLRSSSMSHFGIVLGAPSCGQSCYGCCANDNQPKLLSWYLKQEKSFMVDVGRRYNNHSERPVILLSLRVRSCGELKYATQGVG